MQSTQPISPDVFWSMFEAWVNRRITPGTLWKPGGWSDWAAQDLNAFMLDQVLLEMADVMATGYARGTPYDMVHNFPGALGGQGNLSFACNLNHPLFPTFAMTLHGHSNHQRTEEFIKLVELELYRMQTCRFGPMLKAATPALILLTSHNGGAGYLQKQHGFQHKFSAPVSGQDGNNAGSSQTLHVLSRRVDRDSSNSPSDSDANSTADSGLQESPDGDSTQPNDDLSNAMPTDGAAEAPGSDASGNPFAGPSDNNASQSSSLSSGNDAASRNNQNTSDNPPSPSGEAETSQTGSTGQAAPATESPQGPGGSAQGLFDGFSDNSGESFFTNYAQQG